MKRKLTAKIQKLNPQPIETGKAFAQSLIMEPETRKLALQKGTIYAVYDISSPNDIDIAVVSKIIKDLLHDVYFQTESVSPTQTLEKTLLEIRNKITQLDENQTIKFNMVAAVLWGNVLYTVQFGSGRSYIVQQGEIRPISTMSEGNFSAASGVVNDDDVVIIATETFDKSFPPKKLLAASIPETELDYQQAALLMKFIIDAEFSENEIIDFGLETAKKTPKIKEKMQSIADSMKNAITRKKVKVNQREFKIPRKFMMVLIFALLALPLIALVIKGGKKAPNQQKAQAPTEEQLLGADVKRPADPWEEEKKQDKQHKVVRLTPEAFYDIRIIDDTAQPTEVDLIDAKMVICAKESGKAFISDIAAPDFEKLSLEFPGINSLNDSKGLLSFNDAEGFKYFDVETLEVTESYEMAESGLTDTYMDFIYILSGDQILKFTKEGTELEESVWGEDTEFSNAVSFSIAYSIYLSTNDGEILKYTSGEKDAFTIENVDKPLGKQSVVFADTKLENIYILDPVNKRVVVTNESGDFLRQFKTEEEATWDNLHDLTVADNEQTMYVLSGTKVYIVDLEDTAASDEPAPDESTDTTPAEVPDETADETEGLTDVGTTEPAETPAETE